MTLKRWLQRLGWVIGLSLCLGGGVVAAVDLDEYAIKAGLILNFARFTAWPDSAFIDAHAPLQICLLNADATIVAHFEALSHKSVQQHPLQLQNLAHARTLNECHLVFIAGNDRYLAQQALATAQSLPVLTIAEMTGFIQLGGMINLVMQDKKIRFEINQKAVEQAQLKLSSQLLKLAITVIQQ